MQLEVGNRVYFLPKKTWAKVAFVEDDYVVVELANGVEVDTSTAHIAFEAPVERERPDPRAAQNDALWRTIRRFNQRADQVAQDSHRRGGGTDDWNGLSSLRKLTALSNALGVPLSALTQASDGILRELLEDHMPRTAAA